MSHKAEDSCFNVVYRERNKYPYVGVQALYIPVPSQSDVATIVAGACTHVLHKKSNARMHLSHVLDGAGCSAETR